MSYLILNLANVVYGTKFDTKYSIMPNFGILSQALIGQFL